MNVVYDYSGSVNREFMGKDIVALKDVLEEIMPEDSVALLKVEPLNGGHFLTVNCSDHGHIVYYRRFWLSQNDHLWQDKLATEILSVYLDENPGSSDTAAIH